MGAGRITRRGLFGLALAAGALAGPAVRAGERVYAGFPSGLAADGYDVVAYFREGRAAKGSEAFALEHAGATWRFASAETRDAFAADPAAYMPQFGGHCAWAVSRGYTAKGDPEAWRIVGGKLYLNYNKAIRARWERDAAGNIARGEAAWPRLAAE